MGVPPVPRPTSSATPPATSLAEVTFCVLDLETTGTDPGWDDITEVGAILVRGGERSGTFHTLVGPGHAGIDWVLPSLLDFIGDSVITGHNISFDIRFLNAALGRAERPLIGHGDVVDTMYLARALLRDEADDCRLGTLAARFQFDHRPRHRAFEDAAATVDLLHLLIERSSSFGVVALDDLCELPGLVGHRWAAKLRHTVHLPRLPGVFTCHDDAGRVVWVGAADDLRSDVRALFTRGGSAVHASVLRDTHAWQVHHLRAPLERDVVLTRLLHGHRPRLQRRSVVGDAAAYVCVETTTRGARTSVVRVPKPHAWHLGPLVDRATATSARSGLQRLAAAGAPIGDLFAAGTAIDDAWDALRTTAQGDAVELALLDRDRQALIRAVRMHRRVEHTRAYRGVLVSDGHLITVANGMIDDELLPATTAPAAAGDPLPVDHLAEVLLVADVLEAAGAGLAG